MTDRILTLHPAGKQGVRIDKRKYDELRRVLLGVIPANGEGVRFMDLAELIEDRLDPDVFGPDVGVPWYVTTVKQDLEARRLIAQVPKARPQRLLRTSKRGPRA